MEFGILFSLETTNTFYGDGPSPDIVVNITDDTMKLLNGARIVTRRHEERLYFLFLKGEEALLPEEGAVLRFTFTSTDPAFAIYTALPFTPGDGIFLFRNARGQAAFGAPQVARPAGSSFSHQVQLEERPLLIKLETAAGETLETVTVAETGEVTVPFRLAGRGPGLYRLKESAGGKKAEALYYLLDGLRGEKPFAVAEVMVGSNWPSLQNPPALKVALTAQEDYLIYYIVGEKCSPADMAHLAIEDAGNSGITFKPDNADDFAASLVQGKDAQVAVFRSTKRVPRTARARKKIRLKMKSEPFIENLPQPTAAAPTTSVIFHFTKG